VALVTAAEVRLNLPGLGTSATEDTILDTLIARADAVLANWCGYDAATEGGAGAPTLEDVTFTRYLKGPGGRALQLPFYPIVSVTTIEDDTTETFNGSTYLVSSSDYSLRKDEGIVLLKQTATRGTWSESESEVLKVVWVAGWATVPYAMKQACIQLVIYWYNQRGTLGKSSVNAGGFSVSPRDETIPTSVKELMAPYRLLRAWA
jgi:hypothetical protein